MGNNQQNFYLTCQEERLEVIKYLIEKGLDVKGDNSIALRCASSFGHFELVKFLIEKGADVIAENNLALGLSSQNGYFEIVKYLVENGADVTANDNGALRWASEKGHFKIVKYLIEKGANFTLCTKEHQKLFFVERFYKKWRRNHFRLWAISMIPIFFHPLNIGGRKDRNIFQKELFTLFTVL